MSYQQGEIVVHVETEHKATVLRPDPLCVIWHDTHNREEIDPECIKTLAEWMYKKRQKRGKE